MTPQPHAQTSAAPVRVYYYRGGVERGCTEGGRPSYRWHDGYSANNASGCALYPWQTIRECQAEAKRDGLKAEFFDARGLIDSDRMPVKVFSGEGAR